ncbi:DgyrCDS8435 [Dimorphilus gyrociliatus]|uniref:DgyrCDS8435 n=1 Tax=Dimorphilus gyrociliatus TaxID=2664684 RepID=A0A7I8VUD3_9ANNE|nr:DgyrCDS8435 [Dimorphilus gyrociliatus]
MHLTPKILIMFFCVSLIQERVQGVDPLATLFAKFQKTLLDFLKSNTLIEKIVKNYNEKVNEFDATTLDIDGSHLVRKLANKLHKILQEKIESLENAVNEAEKYAGQHGYDPNLKLEDVSYKNARNIRENEEGFVYEERLMRNVSYNSSSVHIPVEIYEGDLHILNDLKWTNKLDEVWYNNSKNYDNMLLQYFGSQTGVLRVFPGIKWSNIEPDLYDVRRRPWYTQGASSPKDMLILIDTSGSTYGQALSLIKETAKSLISTLGQNDYVAVANFSDQADYVGCFRKFVQANPRNKQVLLKAIDDLQAKGMAKYNNAFKFAFERIKEFNKSMDEGDLEGANCNKVIMFLTDGGTDTAEEVFENYNWPEKKVRIFTYMVGPQPNPYAAVRWIACANRGYYSRVPAMGDIRSTVQIYLGKLAYEARQLVWTNRFHQRLGIMTTVTLPVYNRTRDLDKNDTLLGVMGTDVTIDELKRHIPWKKLGPNGYAFAINNNGYILFHPDLKAQHGWLSDPPTVDLLEIQIESDDLKLVREEMINKTESTMTVKGLTRVTSDGHILHNTRTYHYIGIENTTFSIAIVLPPYRKHMFDKVNKDKDRFYREAKHMLKDEMMVISPWEWCENITSIPDLLNIDLPSLTCDHKLLDHLLFDIISTSSLPNIWQEANPRQPILSFFFASGSGMTRFYPESSRDTYLSSADVWESTFFKRALDLDKWFFSTSDASECMDENCTASIIAGKSVGTFSGTVKDAVIGVKIPPKSLRDILRSNINRCTDKNFCLLLDDGGFLVVSSNENDDKYIGSFLGSITDQQLFVQIMALLIKENRFNETKVYDYQASCSIVQRTVSGVGKTANLPFFYELLTFKWWNLKISTIIGYFNLFWALLTSSSVSNTVDAIGSPITQNRSCIKKESLYLLQRSSDPHFTRTLSGCNGCTRGSVQGYEIKETNLYLVVFKDAATKCEPSCYDEFLHHKPVENILFLNSFKVVVISNSYFKSHFFLNSILPDDPNFIDEKCDVEKRFRRRPEFCFDNSMSRDIQQCGGFCFLPNIGAIFSMVVLAFRVIQR